MAAAGWHTGAMQLTNSRAGRLLAGSLIVGVGLAGGAVAVMAIEDATSSDPEPGPTTTEVTVTDSTDAPTSSTLALAPGFEDYKPGDPLPTPPPAPASPDETVQTVPGPYGPIYPDGYVLPEFRTPEQGGTHEPPERPTIETRPIVDGENS